MKAEQRVSPRKDLDPIHIEALTSLDNFSLLARTGLIVDASASGFLLHIKRDDFVPKILRKNLNVDCIIGEQIKLSIHEMNLEIQGKVTRTEYIGDSIFEIAIDFSDTAPSYWRECLLDLLPDKGEMEEFDLDKH